MDDLYLRNAPSLAGAGLLERLALELTADLRTLSARHRPLVTHGIDFGTTEHPVGVRPDLIVRPFGRDGKWSTLEEAIREMQTAALGVTDSPGVGHALEAFVAAIPAPGIEPPDAAQMPDLFNHFNAGQRRFREFGCAKCHVPEIPLADGSVVRAYTDLKTHDLGPGPAGSPRTAWVTSPLWGVAASAPYLHDGRALSSLDLAIIYHGGEAATAAAEYQRSGPLAQGELRIFLVSLSPTPRLRIVDR